MLQKKIENEKDTHSLFDYEKDISRLSSLYEKLQRDELLIMRELCDLSYKGIRPPAKLPPLKRETKFNNKAKVLPENKATQLQYANKKIKDILNNLQFHDCNLDSYTSIVDDLKELYGLHVKGADETVDDVVDVMVDLALKNKESNIGVSNSEVIQATLSMLQLDIEQTKRQIKNKDEAFDDERSIHSDIFTIAEDITEIIKVSVQADEEGRKDEIAKEFQRYEFLPEEEQEDRKTNLELMSDIGSDENRHVE